MADTDENLSKYTKVYMAKLLDSGDTAEMLSRALTSLDRALLYLSAHNAKLARHDAEHPDHKLWGFDGHGHVLLHEVRTILQALIGETE